MNNLIGGADSLALLNKIQALEDEIIEITTYNQYYNLSDKITFDDTKCVLRYAYAENGVVTICIGIKPGFTSGDSILTIDSKYAPRETCYGLFSIVSSGANNGKLNTAYISTAGAFSIWLKEELTYGELVQFIYPLKNEIRRINL